MARHAWKYELCIGELAMPAAGPRGVGASARAGLGGGVLGVGGGAGVLGVEGGLAEGTMF